MRKLLNMGLKKIVGIIISYELLVTMKHAMVTKGAINKTAQMRHSGFKMTITVLT